MESLSDDQVRVQVLRDVKRMDGAHRAQLALFLGHDISRDPIDEVGRGGVEAQFERLIETCPLLRERYAAFLHENPSALEEKSAPPASGRRGWRPFAIAAAALAFAVVPLAAQYAHQVGMVDGPAQAFIAPFISAGQPHKAAAASVNHSQPKKRPANHAAQRVAAQHSAPAPAASRPAKRAAARSRAPVAKHRKQYRVGSHWKFAPESNPYFTKRWNVLPRARGIAAGFAAPNETSVQGAARTVTAYLTDVIHGNLPRAPEAGIVSAMTVVRVLSVKPAPGGRTKVDVALGGPRGQYFEVFYVARENNRIVDQYYIPLNRTAAQGLESRNR